MQSTRKLFARLIFPLFLVIFLVIIVVKFSDLEKFLIILSQGVWYFILLVLFLQILYLLSQTCLIVSLYKIYGKIARFKNIFNLYLATNFTNLAIPTGGISGVATFVGYSQKIGLGKTQALIINILMYSAMFLSFSLAILILLMFPNTLDGLASWEKNIIIYFCALVILLNIIFFIMIINQRLMKKIILWMSGLVNKILKLFAKNIISAEKVKYIAYEFTSLKDVISKRTKVYMQAIAYALVGHILHFLVLYFVFLAFGEAVSWQIALVGYIISVVFIVISVTPMGIGIVEPLMIVFFTSCGISLELATIATFVFRGVVFWLPFIWGFFGLKYINYDAIK